MNGGKQMKDVWTGSLTKPSEKREGKHPTQKPEYLLERICIINRRRTNYIRSVLWLRNYRSRILRFGRRKFIGIDVTKITWRYLRRLEKVYGDEKKY